jgi:hypothetical protein
VDAPEPEVTEEPDEKEGEPEQDDDPSHVLPAAVLERIAAIIAETPEERATRRKTEREAAFIAAGETQNEREARHRVERKAAERAATALWRQHYGERVKRFRQWVLLTAVSTGIGWEVGAPQALAHLPQPVQVGAVVAAWWVDWWLRSKGKVRVSEARQWALVGVILTRVPFASALVAMCGLVPTIAVLYGHVPTAR